MKFKMISWADGSMDSPLFEREFEKSTVADAFIEAEESVEKAKQSFPLFDFGLKKIIRIENGDEIEVSPAL